MKLLAVFVVVFALFASESYAASPVSKAHTKADYLQDCGNGKRAPRCFVTKDIELSWDTPTQREDNSALALSEISHYVISMQLNGGVIQLIHVGKRTTFMLRSLPEGTYTFAIATVDSDKQQGAFSPTIQVTIS